MFLVRLAAIRARIQGRWVVVNDVLKGAVASLASRVLLVQCEHGLLLGRIGVDWLAVLLGELGVVLVLHHLALCLAVHLAAVHLCE